MNRNMICQRKKSYVDYLAIPFYIISILILINISFYINPGISSAAIEFGWVAPDPNIESALIEEGRAIVVTIPGRDPSYTQPMDDMKNRSLVRNQPGQECVGFSVASLMEYHYGKKYPSKAPATFSPIDIFCRCKDKEIELKLPGGGNPDAGTSIYLAAIYVLREHGVYPEDCNPCCQADTCSHSNVCSTDCSSRITSRGYVFVNSNPSYQDKLAAMQSVLFQDLVFLAGIPIFSNWDYALRSGDMRGDVPEPGLNSYPVGGHALCFVGYEKDPGWPGGGYFWFKNSWGDGWGDDGYGRVSYDYMRKYAQEIVIIDESEILWSESISGEYCGQDPCQGNLSPEIIGITFGLSSTNDLSIDTGIDKELHFFVSATDEDIDDHITYSLKDTSENVDLDLDSGEFRWTPKSGGTYNFEIVAKDICGEQDTATIKIKVPGTCPPCPKPTTQITNPFQINPFQIFPINPFHIQHIYPFQVQPTYPFQVQLTDPFHVQATDPFNGSLSGSSYMDFPGANNAKYYIIFLN